MIFLISFHNILFVYFNNPSGFTLDKILLAISIFIFFQLISPRWFLKSTSGIIKVFLLLFFTFCLFSFFRGIYTGINENRFQNALNPVFGFSVIVPFFLLIPFNKQFSIDFIFKILILFTKIGIFLTPITFFLKTGYDIPFPFLSASFFLIIFLKKIRSMQNRVLIFLGIICYLIVGLYSDNRTIFLRIFLQFIFLLLFVIGEKITGKKLMKGILVLTFILVPIFTYLFYSNIFNNDQIPIFGKVISNEDTRTNLYLDVTNDLISNKDILFGKGTLGKYYSTWFFKQMDTDQAVDFFNRSHVEVGILSYLLRGGLILTLLFFFSLINIGFQSLSSKNYIVCGIAFIILNHVLISFIENIPRFSVYDVLFWILLGSCVKYRFMPNSNIENLTIIKDK